jgi:chemotaxis protein MotB
MADEEPKFQQKEQPIIIKKKRAHGGHGAHGGSWKVAYADFVTAMMAFFIVMWILGQADQIKKSVTAYFKDPGAYNFVTGKLTIPVDLGLQAYGEGDSKQNEKGKFNFVASQDFWDSIKAAKSGDADNAGKDKKIKKAIIDSISAAQRVESTAEAIQKYISEELDKKPEMKEILSSIKIEMTKEGLRIELIETKDALFFEIGSADVRPKARDILIELAHELGKLPNFIDIEGHTDSRQYGSGSHYDNWDLSANRANSSRRILEQSGLWEGQVLKVIGNADKKLRNPSNPFDISNRRISLLVRQLNVNDLLNTNN